MITAILGTIASIAAMVGIDRLVNKYDRYKLTKNNINMAELTADLRQVLSAAQSKGNKLLSEVTTRINNLPSFISGNDAIRNAIRNQKKELNSIAKSVEETLDKDKSKLDNYSSQLTEISMDPDYLKDTKQIKDLKDNINKSSESINNKFDNLEKRLSDV